MRLRLLSDIHFEHHADFGRSFVDSLDPTGVDVLVLAGDICTVQAGLSNALRMFCEKFKHVVFVPGNHEYYQSDRGRVNATLGKAIERHDNLHVLDQRVVTIEGKRFIGVTMWFPSSTLARSQAPYWSDFQCIQGFAKWVFQRNESDVAFLRKEMSEGDIVVTHYLPSFESVHPKFAMTSTNCYFVCDIEDLITERKPALHLHGHTHESCDYKIGPTRVVCNPFGYAGKMLNPVFKEDLTIEV